MQLLETDWDAPGGASAVPVEYPDGPIQEFMNWIRCTSSWIENPELVERRVRKLNAQLADYRNGLAQPTGESAAQKQARLAAEQAAIAAQVAADEELERLTRPDHLVV